jgi:SecD/SecF fusion protein
MVYLSFATALAFLVVFIWYLASTEAATRRVVGAWTIIAALATCLFSIFPLKDNIKLGLDLEGGSAFTIALEPEAGKEVTPQAVQSAIEVIAKRMDVLGGREIIIQALGGNRLNVQIPGASADDRETAARQISRVAALEFRIVHPNSSSLVMQAEQQGGLLPAEFAYDWEIIPMTDRNKNREVVRSKIVVWKPKADEIAAGGSTNFMSGKYVQRAFRNFGDNSLPVVALKMDTEGAQKFGELTEAHIGEPMAIVLDGEARSAPVIRARLTTDCVISGGGMTTLEAEELASVLENPLENKVTLESQQNVDPSLGRDSIRSGWNAGLTALFGVVIFMLIYYRTSGLIAVIALMANLIILLGLLAQLHFTLTLPGIAGIILTIGMAVDANVLIYERIRDELNAGKPPQLAIDIGFGRAFSAIVDSNITTIIAAVVLAIFGTGPLRGFAVTLALGIVANLFAALVVTRNGFDWVVHYGGFKKISMMPFFTGTRFDFLKYRFGALALSFVVLIAGALALQQRGATAFGVDFLGGDRLVIAYGQLVPVSDVRSKLEGEGLSVALVQYGGDQELMLQVKDGQGQRAEQILMAAFPEAKFAHRSLDSIGPRVGSELRDKAILALGLGLLGIFVYASLRFEWSYALAATAGQVHDVTVTLAIVGMLGQELDLTSVAAFLAIAGYSINDKIVIFDRVRESIQLKEPGSFYELLNLSLNRCLSRSVLTTGTTLVSIVALMLLGGSVIHGFSVTMFVGVLTGFYASHFIAPVLAYWLDAYKEKQERTASRKSEAPAAA